MAWPPGLVMVRHQREPVLVVMAVARSRLAAASR